ncbi:MULTISPECIES: MarR family winged helix-turn-helix transcriptional regulator [unclassified Bradyrhizobium]
MAKTEATRCNLTALRKATRRVSQLYDQVLAASGLRGTQRAILVHVRRTGAPTMGELAAALVLDRTALNHNLKPLARDGLLTITVDKNDRRSRLVRLTKRGEARLAESQAAWLEAQDRFETAFGARQAADLRQTLELVAALEFGEPAADVPAS